MNCEECGAGLPEQQGCLERFHNLLGAEQTNGELLKMHGLTVLTFHLQHPSLTKAWYQAAGYELMRRCFAPGSDWWEVMSEGKRKGTDQQEAARWKARYQEYGTRLPDWVITGPVQGEHTVAEIDPEAPAGQTEAVLTWGRSVAQGRVRLVGTLSHPS